MRHYSPPFHDYTKQIIENARALAQALVAKDYQIISGGTDNHLMLIDLRNKKISGKKSRTIIGRSWDHSQ